MQTVQLIGAITASGIPSVTAVIAAVVVLFAGLFGGRSALSLMSAASSLGHAGSSWDNSKGQFLGSLVGLAVAAAVGAASFQLGGVGATF